MFGSFLVGPATRISMANALCNVLAGFESNAHAITADTKPLSEVGREISTFVVSRLYPPVDWY